MIPPAWSPVHEGHPLATLHAATVGQGVRLVVEVLTEPVVPIGPGASTLTAFRAFLDADEFGRTREPFVAGLHQRTGGGDTAWLRVTSTAGHVHVEQGEIEVPDGVDVQVIEALANLVPAGGHLQMEYDSAYRHTTARALAHGVPPVATPLGGMMFSAGCGVAFTDRYITAGGVRTLQGYRALDRAHEALRAPVMLADLERFMEHSADLDWDLQLKCRPVAEAAITVLRARLGVLARDFDITGGTAPGHTEVAEA